MSNHQIDIHMKAASRVAYEQRAQYRAARFKDRRKEASKRACRGHQQQWDDQ